MPVINLMSFLLGTLMILFAAIMFILERGTFTVNEDYPDGEFLRFTVNSVTKEISPFRYVIDNDNAIVIVFIEQN